MIEVLPVASASQKPAYSQIKSKLNITRKLEINVGSAVLCALIVRLLVAFARYKYIAAPTLEHGDFGAEMGWVARSLAQHQGFSSPFFPRSGPTALLPPAFPFVLSIIFRLTGIYTPASALLILSVQIACSVLTCIPLFFISRRLHSEKAANLAVWLWAFYPISVYYCAGEVWDYALTSLLFASSIALLLKLKAYTATQTWFAAGLLIGAAGLTNPSVLPGALFLAFSTVKLCKFNWKQQLLKGFILLIATASLLVPWSVRNAHLMGAWIPVRDGFWLEAWAGNHGDDSVTNPPSAHPASNPAEMALYLEKGELGYILSKRFLATDWVVHHPRAFAHLCGRRILRFWTGFWSLDSAYLGKEPFDIPSTILCSTVTALMLVGLKRLHSERMEYFSKIVIVLALFPLPYYVTHASMDYRQPIEPIVVVLVSIGLLRQSQSFSKLDLNQDTDQRQLIG